MFFTVEFILYISCIRKNLDRASKLFDFVALAIFLIQMLLLYLLVLLYTSLLPVFIFSPTFQPGQIALTLH